jgi:hypothetical protein
MSTFITLMRHLSSKLLSFPVPSAFGSTKLFKANLVYQALLERVVMADLSSDSWKQTAYSTGPTHYYFLNLNYGPFFKSHDLEIYSNLSPYECEKYDTFPIVYLFRTDFGIKQGLNYIINISLKTLLMLELSHSSRINIPNAENNIRNVNVSHLTMILRQLEPYSLGLPEKKQYAFAIEPR